MLQLELALDMTCRVSEVHVLDSFCHKSAYWTVTLTMTTSLGQQLDFLNWYGTWSRKYPWSVA